MTLRVSDASIKIRFRNIGVLFKIHQSVLFYAFAERQQNFISVIPSNKLAFPHVNRPLQANARMSVDDLVEEFFHYQKNFTNCELTISSSCARLYMRIMATTYTASLVHAS